MQIINYFLVLVFTLFAYVQLNDPDGWIWAIIYMIVALVCLFAAFNRYHLLLLKVLIAATIVGLLFLSPNLYDAIVNYVPDKAPDPTVTHTADVQTEAMKEFFGLLIGGFVLIFQYKHALKH